LPVPQKHYFVCGIGGSGMLPLAVLLLGAGHKVSGSDRSYDQGRTPEKFDWIKKQGIELFPQDGSGISNALDAVVISKAVEDTVPDIAAAKAKNVSVLKRADMLIELFNEAKTKIAISGTSGKTTTTGMTGFLFREAGRDPTVMNGGVFLNYYDDNPYATAFTGKGDVFITEVDESDGADVVAAYDPHIAVLHNVTLDHQPMEELREMFSRYTAKAKTVVLNSDDTIVCNLADNCMEKCITYGIDNENAMVCAYDLQPLQNGIKAKIRHEGKMEHLSLVVPGKHNVSNALAAISVGLLQNVPLRESVRILSGFKGIKRRMEMIGTGNGIAVMDDFAHNPDKVTATLSTLKQFSGRLIIFFQPHGYGFLKVVGKELAEAFAAGLGKDDLLYLVEPLYMGGTVDRTLGSSHIVQDISAARKQAELLADRKEALEKIAENVRAGDRVVVMGARDDSLSGFARDILARISLK
jgi:UDP-N-acetylmuramate--alanine ligase